MSPLASHSKYKNAGAKRSPQKYHDKHHPFRPSRANVSCSPPGPSGSGAFFRDGAHILGRGTGGDAEGVDLPRRAADQPDQGSAEHGHSVGVDDRVHQRIPVVKELDAVECAVVIQRRVDDVNNVQNDKRQPCEQRHHGHYDEHHGELAVSGMQAVGRRPEANLDPDGQIRGADEQQERQLDGHPGDQAGGLHAAVVDLQAKGDGEQGQHPQRDDAGEVEASRHEAVAQRPKRGVQPLHGQGDHAADGRERRQHIDDGEQEVEERSAVAPPGLVKGPAKTDVNPTRNRKHTHQQIGGHQVHHQEQTPPAELARLGKRRGRERVADHDQERLQRE